MYDSAFGSACACLQAPGWGVAQKAITVNLLLWTGGPLPPHKGVALLPSIAGVLREVAAAPAAAIASFKR